MALNLTELASVTGWGVSSLRSMNLPLVCGKIRPSDFWRFVIRAQDALCPLPGSFLVPVSTSAPAGMSDLQSIADKFRAPRCSNGRKGASPCRAESPTHSTE